MPPKGAVRTQPLLFEKGGVAVYVSGMQGLIVITSTEEVFDPIRFVSSPKPVYTLVELATPRDIWKAGALMESWLMSKKS